MEYYFHVNKTRLATTEIGYVMNNSQFTHGIFVLVILFSSLKFCNKLIAVTISVCKMLLYAS